jgi:hypothetical protein
VPPQDPSPPAPEPSQSSLSSRSITGLVVVVMLGILFRVATKASYRAEAQTSFLVFVAVVTALMIVATEWPRITGHVLAALFGLTWFVNGIGTLLLGWGHLPLLLSLVLLVTGGSVLWMCLRSFTERSRPAWAFLASTLGVMAVCTLFGAPKVRNILDTTMWYALILPGILGVATVALGMIGQDYREGATPRR